MVRSNPHTTEIIDLDDQTITMIDHDKRNYSVITFHEWSGRWRTRRPKQKPPNREHCALAE